MDYWKLNVYINDAGVDEIDRWLISLPPDAEARIRTFLIHLMTQKYFREPDVKKLKGLNKIYEIRILYRNIQYRSLGCYGPLRNEFTLLIGATKKQQVWSPSNAIKSAEKRCELIHNDTRYVREYDK
jgi:hypothetical protein